MTLKIKIQLTWLKVKPWLNNVLIFIIYLLTQPFVELWKFFKLLLQKGAKLNYPKAWMPIFFALTILSYLARNRYVTNVFGLLLLITIIKWEWDKKDFVHIHRERIIRKLMQRKREATKQHQDGIKEELQPDTQKEAKIEQSEGETKNEQNNGSNN